MSYGHTISLRGDRAPLTETRAAPVLMVCRGIPASGKTTWALQWVAERPENRSRVNRDDLRVSLFGKPSPLTHEQENVVTKVQHTTILSLLKSGRDVVCDDTNLRARTVRELCALAKKAGADVEFKDFETPVELCMERDRHRFNEGGRCVGDSVIRNFAERYLRKGKLPELPSDKEGEGESRTYTPDPKLPKAWLVDVDGTLAKMRSRGPFEWHRVGEDALNEPVAAVTNSIWRESGNLIIVLSGRDGSCRPETERWLAEHGVRFDRLYMRAAGDNRQDAVVKSEIFWNHIAPSYNVLGVFDDRNQVVEMWRELGLTCFQVAPGDF